MVPVEGKRGSSQRRPPCSSTQTPSCGGLGRKELLHPPSHHWPLAVPPTAYSGLQSYTVRVAATNYDQFAIVFFKKVSQNKEYFKTTLYGRSSTPSGTKLRVTLEGPTPTQPPRSPPASAPL